MGVWSLHVYLMDDVSNVPKVGYAMDSTRRVEIWILFPSESTEIKRLSTCTQKPGLWQIICPWTFFPRTQSKTIASGYISAKKRWWVGEMLLDSWIPYVSHLSKLISTFLWSRQFRSIASIILYSAILSSGKSKFQVPTLYTCSCLLNRAGWIIAKKVRVSIIARADSFRPHLNERKTSGGL